MVKPGELLLSMLGVVGEWMDTVKSTDAEFDALCARAIASFNALPPAEQAAHRREQTISFVYGNLRLDGVDVTEEQVRQIVMDLETAR